MEDADADGDWEIKVYKNREKKAGDLVASVDNVATPGVGLTSTIQIPPVNGSKLSIEVTIDETISVATDISIRPRVGLRLYSDEYGEDKFVRIQNFEGKMWGYYNDSTGGYSLVDADNGTITQQVNGQDARLTINGTEILVTGIEANISTPVFSGLLAFEPGEIGQTSMAQVGYGQGSRHEPRRPAHGQDQPPCQCRNRCPAEPLQHPQRHAVPARRGLRRPGENRLRHTQHGGS